MIRHLAVPLLLAALPAVPSQGGESPSRTLSRELCATARLAGTSGSERAARVVAKHLAEAGFEVELDRRVVLMSLPRRIELALYDAGVEQPFRHRIDRFDPDAIPPGDVPLFNAWSPSGRVRAPVVDVGRGLRADYERVTGRVFPMATVRPRDFLQGVQVRARVVTVTHDTKGIERPCAHHYSRIDALVERLAGSPTGRRMGQ